jgi:transglutaminase-like putative cysteine protease
VNLETAFRLSSILLALTGFTGLVLTGELPAVLVFAGTAAFAVGLAQALGYGSGRSLVTLSQRAWTGLMLAAFLFMFADLFWISGDLLPAGIHFLIALMVQKLFTLHERKDFLHLYAISLMELLGAAALTLELWYAAVFAAYLLTAIWTLLLYHLRGEADEARREGVALSAVQARQPGTITSRFFWSTNGIAVGAFCLTLLIFIVTPRIGAGFFEKNRGELIRLSGFSETVDLGTVGSVKLDNTVVMRVEFPDHKGPLLERIYFRGASYDVYDGRSWSNTFLPTRRAMARSPEGDFVAAVDRLPEPSAGLRQEILVEALDTTVLFGMPFVESVRGSFSAVQIDGLGNVSLPYVPATRFQYSVRSMTPTAAETRRKPRPGEADAIRHGFLQLPAVGSRVTELARRIAPPAASPYDTALAVEQHLKQNYQYSLDVGMAPTANPVEEFLFTRRTGYCDHYATAMVVLLRTLGIPSRLATGFARGEWNDVGNYYTVRQRDAHAWVEVYVPESGWVTFDPTPNVPITLPHPLVVRVGKVFDSLRLKWDRFVIRYSFRDQVVMAQGIRDRGDAVRARAMSGMAAFLRWGAELRSVLAVPGRWYGWLLSGGVILLCALAGLVLGWGLRQGNRWAFRRSGGPPAQHVAAFTIYGRMLQCLRSHGLRKAPNMTPLEFAGRVARDLAGASRFVTPITELYCRVRFGQFPPSPDDLARARKLLAGLQAMPR